MSKPWCHTIGYPVKVFISGVWKEGMICDAYRYEADSVSVLTTNGIVVIYGDSLKEGLIKPNVPDDNPWIPIDETLPDSFEHKAVYITIRPYAVNYAIRGDLFLGKFYYKNGQQIKCQVLAWKPYISPEPYKEVSGK